MNKLIKPLIGILFMLAISFTGHGQMRFQRVVPVRRGMPLNRMGPGMPGRRIEMVKENFIGRQLRLTPDEARAFWPVYRQYVQDQTAVQILKRQNNSNAAANGTEQIDRELGYESQLVEIRKRYSEEFKRILPPEKVSELYKSERQFKDEMLKQLSERPGVRVPE
jgi:hypothetical protein